jgi:hypothetical protein
MKIQSFYGGAVSLVICLLIIAVFWPHLLAHASLHIPSNHPLSIDLSLILSRAILSSLLFSLILSHYFNPGVNGKPPFIIPRLLPSLQFLDLGFSDSYLFVDLFSTRFL